MISFTEGIWKRLVICFESERIAFPRAHIGNRADLVWHLSCLATYLGFFHQLLSCLISLKNKSSLNIQRGTAWCIFITHYPLVMAFSYLNGLPAIIGTFSRHLLLPWIFGFNFCFCLQLTNCLDTGPLHLWKQTLHWLFWTKGIYLPFHYLYSDRKTHPQVIRCLCSSCYIGDSNWRIIHFEWVNGVTECLFQFHDNLLCK